MTQWRHAATATGTALDASFSQRVISYQRENLIQYLRLNEAAGPTATDFSPQGNDGAYVGVTLGVTGIGDGETASSFTDAPSFVRIHSAGLQDDFASSQGSINIWVNLTSGVTTDAWGSAQAHQFFWLQSTGVGRVVSVQKANAAETIRTQINTTGGNVTVDSTGHSSGWISIGLAWDASVPLLRQYVNGTLSGSTDGAFSSFVASSIIVSSATALGAQSTSGSVGMTGRLAHYALWNTPLSSAEFAAIGAL
jgi:hypothetical protein